MNAEEKERARTLARKAFPVLIKCERCPNTTDLERHHPDLSLPLLITVLCKPCHGKEHRRIGRPAQKPDVPELLYMRIAEDVISDIERGELRPGDRLPARITIAARYEVAIPTVKRAMKELRDRGLIESIWGKGTFVKEPEQ